MLIPSFEFTEVGLLAQKISESSSFSEGPSVLPPWSFCTTLSRQRPSPMPRLSRLAVRCLRLYLLGYFSRKNTAFGTLSSPPSPSLEWSSSWGRRSCLVPALRRRVKAIRITWRARSRQSDTQCLRLWLLLSSEKWGNLWTTFWPSGIM